MNQTLESLSAIMEETTDGMMGYAQILIDQYHGLMDGMADDMDALKAAVQSDMGNVKEITSQATAALDTIEQILSSYRADALPEISSVEDLQNFLTQMENDFHTLEDQFDTLLNRPMAWREPSTPPGRRRRHLWITCPSSSTTPAGWRPLRPC